MSDTDSDEDLKRAIALSLGENLPPSRMRNAVVVDLTSSDQDDDLDAPLTARQIASTKPSYQSRGSPSCESSSIDSEKGKSSTKGLAPSEGGDIRSKANPSGEADNPSRSEPSSSTVFLGLNRKQMEEERLLRANKRKKGDEQLLVGNVESRKRKASTPPLCPRGQDDRQTKLKLSESSLASKDCSKSSSSYQSRPGEMISPTFQDRRRGANDALQAAGVQFPHGVVKKTWAYGCPREDDIKIEEVLQKNDLELAVLSSFQVDPDWVASKLHPTTRVIWVLQAKSKAEKENIVSGAPNNYRFCFPSMEGNINCMHSKLQLLAHPTHLRVVVPSANLVPYDWGESGSMENVCFLIDLPRLPEGKSTDTELTEFGKELVHFVRSMGLDEKVIGSMRRFDFSRTSHLAFVHSIGGSHSGEDWKRTGYCGLGTAVRNLGLHTDESLNIDVVAASIGNLNEDFIKSIYLAAQGDNGLKEYRWRTNRPVKSKGMTPVERKLSDDLKDRFRIYFPTRETVANSKGGLGAAGTICFQSKWYDSDGFPRHLMRDCKSRRPGMLMHNKMLFVRPQKTSSRGGRAWAYVGSANLSESAWGRLVKDRTTKEPKLNCRNWECGVIISIPAATSGGEADLEADDVVNNHMTDLEVFRGYVPIPMLVPGEGYGTRRPWFYNEQ